MLTNAFRGTLLAGVLSFLSIAIYAQDTISVRTLTFDSITTRKGTWVFPDTTFQFRKVFMAYTLKCDAATTQDQYACGEWDYLTYTNVYDHTGALDSLELEHPLFLVGDEKPDTIEITTNALYDQHQWYAHHRVVDQVNSETDHSIGAGTVNEPFSLDNQAKSVRSQYLFTTSELLGAGVSGGIQRLQFTAIQAGGTIGRLRIAMKNTATMSMVNFEPGMSTVFEGPFAFTNGLNTITLTNPFQWNGSANLVVEMEITNAVGVNATILEATDVIGFPNVARSTGGGMYVDLNNDHIGVDPSGFQSVNDQVTVMCWLNGDPTLQPQNDMLFEGVNAAGLRVLNVHLPWSDGSVYWDAGEAGGYDRINKMATTSEYAGQWNHWAFTKNAITGNMSIYLNGALWHSGSGKTRSMSGIDHFVIGAAAKHNNSYAGLMDDFAVFNTALDATAIQEAYDGITSAHTNYADLVYLFRFNEEETEFRLENEVNTALPGWLMGTVHRKESTPTDPLQNRLISTSTIRPNITFVTGNLVTHPDSILATTPVIHAGVAKVEYHVVGNEALPLDTLFGRQAFPELTFDAAGTQVGSTQTTGTVLINDTLGYFGFPFEVIDAYEIGRFITPYGINLSLGPSGFRWMYDITDYQFLLHDSVELSAGNQQELIDLEFIMIEGIPPREVVDVQEPWGPYRSMLYRDLDDDTQLPPTTVQLAPNAAQWMLRSRLTGHGHNSNTGNYPHCCEWKDNTHSMFANGQQVDSWHIWQTHDCALNPVFPQGGTWPGAREGWCPGDVVKAHDTELTDQVTGSSIELDYQITPVPSNNQGMGNGNYVVAMQLFEFGAPTHGLDAEIYEVKRPTDWEYRSRYNPICNDPLVTLRNAGGTTLTSATFTYGVSGGQSETYTWTGTLPHAQTLDVSLPISSSAFWGGDQDRIFTVSVSAPNGAVDEYADNDSHISHFELPDVYENGLVVWLKTNNYPHENSYTVKDLAGNIVFSHSGFTANTSYYDTLLLAPGCYTFELLDTEDDGLAYWANTAQGNGFMRFRSPNGGNLKLFGPEFGHSIVETFAVGWALTNNEIDPQTTHASIFPNPTDGVFTLQLIGMDGEADIMVSDVLGRTLLTERSEILEEFNQTIDLTAFPAGTYTVRVKAGTFVHSLSVVKY